MIPIILLVCVSGVGVFGIVVGAAMLKESHQKRRDMRVRAEARARLIEASRTPRATVAVPEPVAAATIPQPTHTDGVVQPITPVADLTGVLHLLEQSARFARAPSEPVAPPPRAAKGSVAPPLRYSTRAKPETPFARATPPNTPAQTPPARGRTTIPPPIPSAARAIPKPSRH